MRAHFIPLIPVSTSKGLSMLRVFTFTAVFFNRSMAFIILCMYLTVVSLCCYLYSFSASPLLRDSSLPSGLPQPLSSPSSGRFLPHFGSLAPDLSAPSGYPFYLLVSSMQY